MHTTEIILNHHTATFSSEMVKDYYGDLVPAVVTIEGVEFTMEDGDYVNEELEVSLYMEGSSSDWSDITHAEIYTW